MNSSHHAFSSVVRKHSLIFSMFRRTFWSLEMDSNANCQELELAPPMGSHEDN